MSRTTRLREQFGAALEAQQYAEELKEQGKLRWLADDPDCPDMMRLAALTEELGEVARALHDDDPEDLKRELAQLTGIALAWRSIL